MPDRDVSKLYTSTPEADGIVSIAVNGKAIDPPVKKGYAVIDRTWKAGDKIDLVIPMKVQRIKGDEKIEATRGQVALRYGPLVYTAENVDQEIDKVLKPNTPLNAQWRPDFLGGVPVIKGKWADGSPLIAIPYYARNNRKATDEEGKEVDANSSVWVKDQ